MNNPDNHSMNSHSRENVTDSKYDAQMAIITIFALLVRTRAIDMLIDSERATQREFMCKTHLNSGWDAGALLGLIANLWYQNSTFQTSPPCVCKGEGVNLLLLLNMLMIPLCGFSC